MKLLSLEAEVTRSLSSNLIKFNYVNYDDEDKIVIDSDSKLPFFKPLGFDNLEIVKTSQLAEAEGGLDGFVPGLQAMPISQVEERDFEAIKKEADDIINNANEEAKSIIVNAKAEVERMKEEAKNVGFQQGYQEGKDEVLKLQEDLKNQILENAKEQQRIIQSIEPQYTDLVVKLLEKLTGIVSSEYKSVILHLIKKALVDNENDEKYCIRVAREDYEFVKNKVDEVRSLLKENAIVEIVIDSELERSQCFIETDTSIIDCSLDVQLENLITDLRFLAGKF